jgi:hypothetical protein
MCDPRAARESCELGTGGDAIDRGGDGDGFVRVAEHQAGGRGVRLRSELERVGAEERAAGACGVEAFGGETSGVFCTRGRSVTVLPTESVSPMRSVTLPVVPAV